MSLSTESQSGTRWQRVVLATSRWWCSPKPNGVSPTRSAPCKQLNWTRLLTNISRVTREHLKWSSRRFLCRSLWRHRWSITEKILVDVTNSICVLTDVIINFSGTCKSKRELHLFFLTDIYLHGNLQGYYFKSKLVIFILTAKKLLLCSGKIQILTSDSSLFAGLHSAAQQSFRFNLESKHRVISMWRHFPAKRCWSISWKGESCTACPRAPTRF